MTLNVNPGINRTKMPEMIPTDGNTVAVVGGGLGGALAAIALQQRGFTVHLFEGREDWRVDTKKALDKVFLQLPAGTDCQTCAPNQMGTNSACLPPPSEVTVDPYFVTVLCCPCCFWICGGRRFLFSTGTH